MLRPHLTPSDKKFSWGGLCSVDVLRDYGMRHVMVVAATAVCKKKSAQRDTLLFKLAECGLLLCTLLFVAGQLELCEASVNQKVVPCEALLHV